MSIKDYWNVTRNCLNLPVSQSLSTRSLAKLMGTSTSGVVVRMQKYHILPTIVPHAKGSGVMHFWNSDEVIQAAKLEWGLHSHLAPVSRIEAERIVMHIAHLRNKHTVKDIAEKCDIPVNVLSKWIQRETAPNIGQRKALLAKFPMVGCL